MWISNIFSSSVTLGFFSWSREGLRPMYLPERARENHRCCSSLCCRARRARAFALLHFRPPASKATSCVAACRTAMSPCATPEAIAFSGYQRIADDARTPARCGNAFLVFRAPTGNILRHPGICRTRVYVRRFRREPVLLALLSAGRLGRSPVYPAPSFMGSPGWRSASLTHSRVRLAQSRLH